MGGELGGGGGVKKRVKKEEEEEEKRPNSGNCQNTCLPNRKRGGVRGREINASLLLTWIPSFRTAPKGTFWHFFFFLFFKGLFIFSPLR